MANCFGRRLSCARLHSAGISLRFVRSPVAPKMTMTQGAAVGFESGWFRFMNGTFCPHACGQKVPFMNLNHPDSNPTAAPCVMVIFGATGDLTKRKLIPALCNLAQDNLLPKQFAIVGFATNDYRSESFRKMLGEEIPKDGPAPVDVKTWNWLAKQIYYVRGDF